MLIFSENYMIDISQLLMDIIKLFNFYDITHSLVDYKQKVFIFFICSCYQKRLLFQVLLHLRQEIAEREKEK